MRSFGTAIGVIFLAMFVYFGYGAGFWSVMNTWDWNTWAIFFLGCLISWIARNEFGGNGN
jgi:hypothetical protein